MKTLSAALITALENGTLSTCVKLTSKLDGVSLGFTSYDTEITIDTVTYKPSAGLERIMLALRSNAEVSNQEFTSSWVVDIPETELNEGRWDNAEIEVFKINWVNVTDGKVPIFKGYLGLIQWSVDGFRADIHSTMKDLQRNIGIQVTPKCRHQLFSVQSNTSMGYCGINAASFTKTSSIDTVATQKMKFVIPTLGEASGWATNGILTFSSGPNTGLSFEVKSHTTSYLGNIAFDLIELFLPTNYIVSQSETFSITAGCDKTWNTCRTKFSNGARYGGFPHIRNEVNFK